MKPKLLLTLAAIWFGLGGIGQLFAPSASYYLDLDVAAISLAVVRSTVSLLVGMGVVYWFARNSEPSKAKDAIFLGSAVGLGLATAFLVLAALTPGAQAVLWISVAINLLFALAFIVVGRANMSPVAS